jgi:hypothetical protein
VECQRPGRVRRHIRDDRRPRRCLRRGGQCRSSRGPTPAALVHAEPARTATAAWAWALALHLLLGLVWALLYGGIAEPLLRRAGQPTWRRGTVFALGPWAFSVTLFLPLTGAGVLVTGVGAGPLPLLGNLMLHLLYGAVRPGSALSTQPRMPAAALGALLGSLAGMGRAAAGRRAPDDGSSTLAAHHHNGRTDPAPLPSRSARTSR